MQDTADVDEVVGNDAEANPSLHSIEALVSAWAETVSPLGDADPPLGSSSPFLAVAEPALPLLSSALLVERLGMQTRLTPLAFAAASFLAE